MSRRIVAAIGPGLLFLGVSLALPAPAAAAWPADSLVNVPLCTAPDDQAWSAIVPDGAGGAIVAWQDHRGGADFDIYVQRVLASGVVDPVWPAGGLAVCTAAGDQVLPAMVPDGAGGAIAAWQDHRVGFGSDIHAQRILASGVVDPAWPADGLALCVAAGEQTRPEVVPDGARGAIVSWFDRRGDGDVYAQRVLASGVVDPAWPVNGLAVCAAAGLQFDPAMTVDGTGGAIVAWMDFRSLASFDIYAQRILATGVVDPVWPADGRAVCTVANQQLNPAITPDGSGGAIVAWEDDRDAVNIVLYAQRVLGSGVVDPAWPANGLRLCPVASDQRSPVVVSDGAGGAIATWEDGPSGNRNLYAQRVLAGGIVDPAWPVIGAAVCAEPGSQESGRAISDGAGGAIVVWEDTRGGVSWDIYAQRVLAGGAVDPDWPAGGRAVCVARHGQSGPVLAVVDTGGIIIAWEDNRSGASFDIYAQRVRMDGRLGDDDAPPPPPPPPLAAVLALHRVRPNPWPGGALIVHFSLASAGAARLDLFDVTGRRVLEREVGSLGPGPHTADLNQGRRLIPGLYLLRLVQGSEERVVRVVALD